MLRKTGIPSMKVPPKRKGNLYVRVRDRAPRPLNESPSEKEGKLVNSLMSIWLS